MQSWWWKWNHILENGDRVCDTSFSYFRVQFITCEKKWQGYTIWSQIKCWSFHFHICVKRLFWKWQWRLNHKWKHPFYTKRSDHNVAYGIENTISWKKFSSLWFKFRWGLFPFNYIAALILVMEMCTQLRNNYVNQYWARFTESLKSQWVKHWVLYQIMVHRNAGHWNTIQFNSIQFNSIQNCFIASHQTQYTVESYQHKL